MSVLHWTILGCLVLGLVGCSTASTANKDKANTGKPGTGNLSREEQNPTYHWHRPREDAPRPQLPPPEPGERAPF